MSDTAVYIALFVVLALLATWVRIRFFSHGTPLRDAWETTGKARVKKLGGIFGIITVIVWLVIWATADDEARTRFNREFKEMLDQNAEEFKDLKDKVEEKAEEIEAHPQN